MRRIFVALCILCSITAYPQIIADHTVVDRYDDIPQYYIDEVKKMWLSYAGESHSEGVRYGLLALETADPTYAVSVVESGTPEVYTDANLRASRATWGDLTHSTGWIYDYGEEDWFVSPLALTRTKASLDYCNTTGPELAAFGFGWCWDGNYYAVDSINKYILATQEYIDHAESNDMLTRVFFTTGPVDSYTLGLGYLKYLAYEQIRDSVLADPNRILFDYADILCYDDGAETPNTATYNGHTYPTITDTNLGDGTVAHIGEAGALRLGKAMWWMLARMAGWDGSAAEQSVFYVQDVAYNANASDSNAGTNIDYPWATWQHAFETADAGDTVYFRGGVWYPTTKPVSGYPITLIAPNSGYGNNGTHDSPIVYMAYPPDYAEGNVPILDCQYASQSTTGNIGINIDVAEYLEFHGLTIRNVLMLNTDANVMGIGMTDCTGTMTFERIVTHNIGGAGQWYRGFDTLYLKNCDSYLCCDSLDVTGAGGDGDGFVISARGVATDTNRIAYVKSCRAWNVSDDGFDIGSMKQLQIDSCWSWGNGIYYYSDDYDGDGYGFKLTASTVLADGKRWLRNCVSAYNEVGFGDVNLHLNPDYGPRMYYFNNTSYRDDLPFMSGPGAFDCETDPAHVVYKNNIAYAYTYGFPANFNSCAGVVPPYIDVETNTFILGSYNMGLPNPAYSLSDADFVSRDTAQLRYSRGIDGGLPYTNFMKLSSESDLIDAGTDVDLPYYDSAPDLGWRESPLPFTVIGMPDTQSYINLGEPDDSAKWMSQVYWIRDNYIDSNIVFVSHYGDVTDGNTTTEWKFADRGFDIIESVNIPYGIAPGNHDRSYHDGAFHYENYNTYFGSDRFAGRDYYIGSYGAYDQYNVQFFEAAGMEFMILHLTYSAEPPGIAWADAVLKAYPERRAIVTSHNIANYDSGQDTAVFDYSGQLIYDGLKDNPNLFLMLCGHYHDSEFARYAWRADTYEGNTIYTLFSNYQGLNGHIRLMKFAPDEDTVYVTTYSPFLDSFMTDDRNEFSFYYDMDVMATEPQVDSTLTDILTFTLADQTGAATINTTAHTVAIEVAYTADITSLSPTITLSYGATVIPLSGVARDFTSPVTYTVTALDETTTQEWVVTVTQAEEPVDPPTTSSSKIVKLGGFILKL